MNKKRDKNTTSYQQKISMALHYVYNLFFVRKLVSRASRSRGPFLKFILLSEEKRMKSLMAQKTPKKWRFFRRDVLLYDNKKLILKKGPRGRLDLETSF